MQSEVRVRIAPSPTGFFHIGSARTALYNWLFARKNQGRFILRIEDTDITRSSKEMTGVIFDSLTWLGLDWDEGPLKGGDYGPYYQSERRQIYHEYVQKLLRDNKAYWCYCTPDEIANERNEYLQKGLNWQHRCREKYSIDEIEKRKKNGIIPALRFAVPSDKKIVFNDLIHGTVEKMSSDLEDFVILKSDGMPTYNFACVIDDHLMRISHIIRGVEHIANTPKQILLYEAFNFPIPAFAHLPVILGTDKKKLSKRLGARSVLDYKNEGYLAQALVNFLALLGWSPGSNEEIMDLEDMVKTFSLNRINPANAIYDEKRLEWMNNHYIINRIQEEEFLNLVKPFVLKSGLINEDEYKKNEAWVNKVCLLMRPRLKVLGDIKSARYFFREDFEYEKEVLRKYLEPTVLQNIKGFREEIEKLPEFTASNIEKSLREFATKNSIKARELIHPLRVFLTGTDAGPGLFETMELIGKERCLLRIERILKKYENK
ncbi:MAG: glutamate--tRNA ligase [candidate division WOR-3 bacterium]